MAFLCVNLEAKKMMVEGTVEVQGTVTIDSSAELANLYEIARRAKDMNNAESAAKYYDQVLVKDPNNWEPNFYSVYFNTMSCKIDDVSKAAKNLSNCFKTVLELIKTSITDTSEQYKIVNDITDKTITLGTKFLKELNTLYDERCSEDSKDELELMTRAADSVANSLLHTGQMGYDLGDQIQQLFDVNKYKDIIVKAWSFGIYGYRESAMIYAMTSNGSIFKPNPVLKPQKELAESYELKIKEFSPDTTLSLKPTSKGSGCMVILAILSIPVLSLVYFIIHSVFI